ncbi:chorismate--pyruvate lyase [Bathymodiolus platifrons methanotrophic gill symbiont]|uniref:chorismate--pyruvate lyase family protein n=1 Tax=Bathymodiolus platifrons methanotrophic gill symbiont TaxID=113268 RepID=UPI000B40B284|nr:chorismate lyase [Bathymodiolus platifrons methanotrophic gill symbiont]MCK5870413.1 chorismate lyase [Methyloprofundus sp.]TXK98620.1 chorismate lyase [Methylococcaceae bacterium CS4]TXL00599.1 chorismate lyase [Methylococcaceae bacterium CS5]TXL01636.1 chorismate lyase [Methylococcaceae bacterium HT1]TXL05946.1 chorismate lyase [Methylococcaceae bacterium CS3]TXL07926.1 chorismate lyase [Methylococcaceae bacterium CS1]TXL11552.1 chorismate lyase [Methylococcaceae bacterium CS2]TXL15266
MSNKSSLYPKEPTWFCNRLKSRLNIPAPAASWIYEAGSITQRLRDYYGSRVRVQVLNNQWQRAFISESRLLKTHPEKYSLTREVLLYADDIPLVLARTIIPEATISSAQQNLSHLGNRPLGEVIFPYPRLERLAMQITQVQCNQWRPPIQQKAFINQPLWGRRTVYAIHHHPLLVSEFFLPEILNH